jgi:ParB family chromosome partitioning protein
VRRFVSDYQISPGIIDDIEINKIKPSSYLLRPCTTNIEELKSSIKQRGLLQPIIVRPKEDYFEIVAGNRRYTVCREIGWRKITCHIMELNDKESFEIALIENVQRNTLDPIEEAQAFKKYVSDFGWGGVSELASRLGKSAGYITKRIKILDLPISVLESVSESSINASIAEELCSLRNKDKQSELAKLISRRHLSVMETRKIVRDNKDIEITDDSFCLESYNVESPDIERRQRCIDKSIAILKVSLSRLASVIETIENDWIIYNIMREQNSIIHAQIDFLIKCKRKYVYTTPSIINI